MDTLNGKLLYNKDTAEMMHEFIADFDVFEMNQSLIADTDDHFERFFNMAKNLTEHKYGAARILCGCRDLFSSKSSEISGLRSIIKNLITGLYISSYIRNRNELEILKWHWEGYGFSDCNNTLSPLQNHQKVIYSEFCKVETIADSRLFTEYFKRYVINLVFEMIELSFSQLDTTIAYFQSLNSFDYFCSTSIRRRPFYSKQFRRIKLYNQLMSLQ